MNADEPLPPPPEVPEPEKRDRFARLVTGSELGLELATAAYRARSILYPPDDCPEMRVLLDWFADHDLVLTAEEAGKLLVRHFRPESQLVTLIKNRSVGASTMMMDEFKRLLMQGARGWEPEEAAMSRDDVADSLRYAVLSTQPGKTWPQPKKRGGRR